MGAGQMQTAGLLMALSAASAQASVLVTLDDDGSGKTQFTISGTFDASGGIAAGPGGVNDFFGGGLAQDAILWSHRTTPAAYSLARTFNASLNIGAPILTASPAGGPSLLTIDDFSMDFYGLVGVARIIGWDGANTGTLNESGVYTNVLFSSFHSGVWEFGNYSLPNQGIRLEIGQAALAVPEPAGLAMMAVALALLGAAARRRRV